MCNMKMRTDNANGMSMSKGMSKRVKKSSSISVFSLDARKGLW